MTELAEKLRLKFAWEETMLRRTLRILAHKADIVRPTTVPIVVPDDPDDDAILATAVFGRADVIVSGDRHLLSLKEHDGIPIVRPIDFLRMMGSER